MFWHKQWLLLVALGAITIITTLAAFSRRMFKKDGQKSFVLMSPSFKNDGNIPSFYTCDGRNVSPKLSWESPPSGTQSFVLICHDPDALGGDWIHWIVYNIPANISNLEEHIKADTIGARMGLNSWGEEAYGGPCPPLKRHRYIFTLYALDIPQLVLKEPDYKVIMQVIEGKVLDKAILIGTYQRVKNI